MYITSISAGAIFLLSCMTEIVQIPEQDNIETLLRYFLKHRKDRVLFQYTQNYQLFNSDHDSGKEFPISFYSSKTPSAPRKIAFTQVNRISHAREATFSRVKRLRAVQNHFYFGRNGFSALKNDFYPGKTRLARRRAVFTREERAIMDLNTYLAARLNRKKTIP